METIPKTDCENIGFFRKPHGINGDLILEFKPHFELSVENTDHFFVEIDGLLVPFFVEEDGFRFRTGNSAIVSLKWVDTEKYAKRLAGCEVFLFKTEIIDEEETSPVSQFENYLLTDTKKGEIGIIDHVDDYSGNIVLSVNYRGNEILIPYNDNFLVEVDDIKKTIKLDIPQGLIE